MDATILTEQLDTLWMLVAAVLVFFMQAGFAMVEAGFTRAKNASNIIMKNLMDFAIGSVLFFVVGYGLMYGEDIAGFIGGSQFILPADAPVAILFQTVFCATAATIVSGAMAERTKFKSYVIYSAVISMIIYPIAGHWLWGGGWLSGLTIAGTTGMIDFAGSTLVHSVGGWSALVGAAMLGPRIGKYKEDGTPNAIPGHNITIGALGCVHPLVRLVRVQPRFYAGIDHGYRSHCNDDQPGCRDGRDHGHDDQLDQVRQAGCLDDTERRAGRAWLRSPRAALTSACGASIAIGLVAGVVIIFGVEFVERKLKIDDPVGAITVHGLCGAGRHPDGRLVCHRDRPFLRRRCRTAGDTGDRRGGIHDLDICDSVYPVQNPQEHGRTARFQRRGDHGPRPWRARYGRLCGLRTQDVANITGYCKKTKRAAKRRLFFCIAAFKPAVMRCINIIIESKIDLY